MNEQEIQITSDKWTALPLNKGAYSITAKTADGTDNAVVYVSSDPDGKAPLRITKEFNFETSGRTSLYLKGQSDLDIEIQRILALLGTNSAKVFSYKGTKANENEIKAIQDAEIGEVWQDEAKNNLFVFVGDEWLNIGSASALGVDLSGYVEKNTYEQKINDIEARLNIGSGFQHTQGTEPNNPNENDLWLDTNTGIIKIYQQGAWKNPLNGILQAQGDFISRVGNETIEGEKTFKIAPIIDSDGANDKQAASIKQVKDLIAQNATPANVALKDGNTFTGEHDFTAAKIIVKRADGADINEAVSVGYLNEKLNNVVSTNTAQEISEVKTFTKLPQSAQIPQNRADFVNLGYLQDYLQGKTTGQDGRPIFDAANYAKRNEANQFTAQNEFTNAPKIINYENPSANEAITKAWIDTQRAKGYFGDINAGVATTLKSAADNSLQNDWESFNNSLLANSKLAWSDQTQGYTQTIKIPYKFNSYVEVQEPLNVNEPVNLGFLNNKLTGYLKADANYISETKLQEALNQYAKRSELATFMNFKGQKPTEQDLPQNGNLIGDVWNIADTKEFFIYDGNAWSNLGALNIDLSGYSTIDNLNAAINDLGNVYVNEAQLNQALDGVKALIPRDTDLSNYYDKQGTNSEIQNAINALQIPTLQTDLSDLKTSLPNNYATKSWASQEISDKIRESREDIVKSFAFKGIKENEAELNQIQEKQTGDLYLIRDDGSFRAYNGNSWDIISESSSQIDLGDFATKAELTQYTTLEVLEQKLKDALGNVDLSAVAKLNESNDFTAKNIFSEIETGTALVKSELVLDSLITPSQFKMPPILPEDLIDSVIFENNSYITKKEANKIAINQVKPLYDKVLEIIDKLAQYGLDIDKPQEPQEDNGGAGQMGFGNGVAPYEVAAKWRMTGLNGYSDPNSDNYGNYSDEEGNIFVWIPAFYVRKSEAMGEPYFGTRYDISYQPKNGYQLHYAFKNNYKELQGFFIAKYPCGKDLNKDKYHQVVSKKLNQENNITAAILLPKANNNTSYDSGTYTSSYLVGSSSSRYTSYLGIYPNTNTTKAQNSTLNISTAHNQITALFQNIEKSTFNLCGHAFDLVKGDRPRTGADDEPLSYIPVSAFAYDALHCLERAHYQALWREAKRKNPNVDGIAVRALIDSNKCAWATSCGDGGRNGANHYSQLWNMQPKPRTWGDSLNSVNPGAARSIYPQSAKKDTLYGGKEYIACGFDSTIHFNPYNINEVYSDNDELTSHNGQKCGVMLIDSMQEIASGIHGNSNLSNVWAFPYWGNLNALKSSEVLSQIDAIVARDFRQGASDNSHNAQLKGAKYNAIAAISGVNVENSFGFLDYDNFNNFSTEERTFDMIGVPTQNIAKNIKALGTKSANAIEYFFMGGLTNTYYGGDGLILRGSSYTGHSSNTSYGSRYDRQLKLNVYFYSSLCGGCYGVRFFAIES